jgi:hypothetical protein
MEYAIHEGKLVGNGLELGCKVRVEEGRPHDLRGNPLAPIYGRHEILSVDGDPPDGYYRLFVHGNDFNFQFRDSEGEQIR